MRGHSSHASPPSPPFKLRAPPRKLPPALRLHRITQAQPLAIFLSPSSRRISVTAMRAPPAVAAAILLLLCCTAITASHAALADDWTPQSAGLSHAYTAAAPAWSDEFAAPSTTSSGGVSVVTQPDQTKWSKITGAPKFNGELQTYVDDAAHSAVSSGKLHLVASRDAPASLGSGFQSAKLSTAGQVSFHYGLFAVRARLPRGRGLWPSIWLFGDAAGEAAKYEEISIAELGAGGNDGRAASVAWFSKGDKQSVVRAGVPAALSVEPAAFADDFHVFWLEWTPHALTVGLDGVGQVLASDLSESGAFQSPMHLVLNVAVGGGWTGAPSSADVTAELPQAMQVDWVRYWAAPDLANAGLVAPPASSGAASATIPVVAGIELDRSSPLPTSTALPTSDSNTDGDGPLLPGSEIRNGAAEHSGSRWAHVVTLCLLIGAQVVLISLL